jgi:hypothetical protein
MRAGLRGSRARAKIARAFLALSVCLIASLAAAAASPALETPAVPASQELALAAPSSPAVGEEESAPAAASPLSTWEEELAIWLSLGASEEEQEAAAAHEALLAVAAGTTAALAPAPASAPALSVSGGTVRWSPAASETSYRIAISTAPRGAAARSTRYFNQTRAPGAVQSYTPALLPGQTVYVGVSANGGVTWSASEVSVSLSVPLQPRVSGGVVQWAPIAGETSYKVAISTDARGTADRSTQYVSVPRVPGAVQSYTPVLSPGQTVYVGVSADGGATWSAGEAALSMSSEALGVPAPVLHVKGNTVSWTAVPGVVSYRLATILNPTTTRETTYTTVTGTSVTPPVVPGETVNYGLAATAPLTSPWAQEVTITYPAAETGGGGTGGGGGGTGGPPPPPSAGTIIGTNDGAGWGVAEARTIIGGHITWNRVEIGSSSNTVAQSLSDGFRVLAIVGNVDDGTPLAQAEPPAQWGASVVAQIRANPGISIAEAGNEMYAKGGVANPVQYGRMYLAAVNAMKAAGIRIPLLFNMTGDYAYGSWSSPSGWSQDAHGGGWLRDAVEGVPGLGAAILANGVSSHPYGALGENEADSNGVNAVAGQESVARAVLGSIPSVYITEVGFDMSRCGGPYGACSQQEQASKMRAAYDVFLADPHIAGIWWYQSHDDGTGQFGFMGSEGATRPSFEVLSSFAIAQGQ